MIWSQWIISDVVYYWSINAFYGVIAVLYACVLVSVFLLEGFLIQCFGERLRLFILCTSGRTSIFLFVIDISLQGIGFK